MNNSGMRTVLTGLIFAGFMGGLGLHLSYADAQTLNTTTQPVRYLASLNWQDAPGQNTNPTQDQSMPAYRQPAPPQPQESAPPYVDPNDPVTSKNADTRAMDEALPPYKIVDTAALGPNVGSTYIPLDSWMYPALMRLAAQGYLTRAFLDMRPWTRISVLRMLYAEQERIHVEPNNEDAVEIYDALMAELEPDVEEAGGWQIHTHLDSVYERARGIGGTPLNDNWHLGKTIINDYGRPYEGGFNNYAGFSGRASSGPFALYVRGEYQHTPSADGYSQQLAARLSSIENIPYDPTVRQATIPVGPISSMNAFRLMEANISATVLNHDISFGKSDVWDGPALGGAFDWSNNAENIYSFRINRVEPLHIPLLSYVLGPVRYEFLVGSLKGHTYPNEPWVHMEKFAFNPTPNFEFGFSRTVIWGGKGHTPITLGSFWHSFTSFQNVSVAEKFSRKDPGARFSTFDFTYRLPFVRNWLTLYTDSESHDDVTPVSAPRRAGIRTGLYLNRIPGAPKFDLRTEAVFTDLSVSNSVNGSFLYIETIQEQGYTNKGDVFGDWIGRESKGGQAWLTYHLSPQEMVQLSYRNAKAAKDFIPGGTTQNLFAVTAVKRIRPDIELNGSVQYERWSAPIYKTGAQSDVKTDVQVTWYPQWKKTLRGW